MEEEVSLSPSRTRCHGGVWIDDGSTFRLVRAFQPYLSLNLENCGLQLCQCHRASLIDFSLQLCFWCWVIVFVSEAHWM